MKSKELKRMADSHRNRVAHGLYFAHGRMLALSVAVVSLCAVPAAAFSDESDGRASVSAIFAEHCISCHGPQKAVHHLRVDWRSSLLRGGDSGEPAIVPGEGAAGELMRRITSEDPKMRMPHDAPPLSKDEINKIKQWIADGAPMARAADEPADGEKARTDLWSFQPPKAVQPPDVGANWVRNDIDRFIVAKLNEAGLSPSPMADRRTLIRRVYLVMLGLPPTPQQIEAFVHDQRPDAYDRLVEQVLASPRYGERWGQHWLDVVRYADTHGFEVNTPRDNAWPYRDYVIRSLNEDKPYDQFIREQFVGDQLGVDEATGFLVSAAALLQGQIGQDEASIKQARQDELDEMIINTGAAFLGLTLGCAECHNHKFDPVSQKDYYSLKAVFAGVYYGERTWFNDLSGDKARALAELDRRIAEIEQRLTVIPQSNDVSAKLNTEVFAPTKAKYIRFTILDTNLYEPCIDELEVWSHVPQGEQPQNLALASRGGKASTSAERNPTVHHKLEHINDGLFGNAHSWMGMQQRGSWVQIELPQEAVIDRITWARDREGRYDDRLATRYIITVATDPDRWTVVAGSHMVEDAQGAAKIDIERLVADSREIEQLRARRQAMSPDRRVFAGTFRQPPMTHRLYRGDPMFPREVVAPDVPNVLGSLQLSVDAEESQRRTALADWIASPDNPLTARVMVNRLWHHHFGTGIVDTPGDFGNMGAKPTHPELLDWLALQFIKHDWSIKDMHRLILHSATFRQNGQTREDGLAVDAQSRLLWRYPARRLEAEPIRDGILYVTGQLDLTMGGPGFSVFKPNDNYVRVYEPREEFGPEQWRRMIYAHRVRMEKDGVFGAFDRPDAGQVCPERSVSTTAIQALNLFNSSFVAQQSQLLAERLQREAGDDRSRQIDRAFALVLGRQPDEVERAAGVELVDRHSLAVFCRVMLNTNEFLMIP